jgi:hypothetical protein
MSERFGATVGEVLVSKADAEPMQMEIAEKANATGSYEFLGEAFFVDDVIDPSIVRRIREFVPEYVPLLVKRQYRTPAGTEIQAVYHVIGRYIEHPTEYYQDSAVKLATVPNGFPFNPRKIHPLRTLWAPWAGPNERGEGSPPDPEWRISAPPGYVKPEGWLVEQMRALHKALEMKIVVETDEDGEVHQTTDGQRDFTVDKLNDILEAEARRDEEIRKKAIGEARYRMRHNWKQFQEAADKERWTPEPPDDRRPFMDLGGQKT